jgi:hypothetical protein
VKAISRAKIGLAPSGGQVVDCEQEFLTHSAYYSRQGSSVGWPKLTRNLVGPSWNSQYERRPWSVKHAHKKFQATPRISSVEVLPYLSLEKESLEGIWSAPALEFLGHADKKFQCRAAPEWGGS